VVVRLSLKSLRGFSLIEVGVVLALLAVLSLVAVSAFGSTRSGVRSAAAGPLLRSAQLELRRGALPDGSFPTDPVAVLTAAGVPAGAGNRPAGIVSVLGVDSSSVVFAAGSRDDCLVLVDRPAASSTWALFISAGPSCDASLLAQEALALTAGGTSSDPQEVSAGG
jgi:prepilin-type N-terminal cleavage/methylation domain-containing protein